MKAPRVFSIRPSQKKYSVTFAMDDIYPEYEKDPKRKDFLLYWEKMSEAASADSVIDVSATETKKRVRFATVWVQVYAGRPKLFDDPAYIDGEIQWKKSADEEYLEMFEDLYQDYRSAGGKIGPKAISEKLVSTMEKLVADLKKRNFAVDMEYAHDNIFTVAANVMTPSEARRAANLMRKAVRPESIAAFIRPTDRE